MDLAGQFIFGIIFGIAGYIIGKIWGFNPATIAGDIGTIAVMVPLIVIIMRVSINPQEGILAIQDLINWFVKYWPGMIIGEVAGNVVGAVTGEKT
jgi:hypothetical protein